MFAYRANPGWQACLTCTLATPTVLTAACIMTATSVEGARCTCRKCSVKHVSLSKLASTATSLPPSVMQVTRDRLLRDFEPQEAGVQLSTQYGSGYPGGALTALLCPHCRCKLSTRCGRGCSGIGLASLVRAWQWRDLKVGWNTGRQLKSEGQLAPLQHLDRETGRMRIDLRRIHLIKA